MRRTGTKVTTNIGQKPEPVLQCFTRRRPQDITFTPRPELLYFPMPILTSRLEYRPDLFHFELKAETVAELRAMKLPKLSWEECCLHRAEQLLGLDREVYELSYSGGIDSTCAMVALLRVWSAKDLKKLRIRLSHHSIDENPTFFDRYITRFRLRNSVHEPSASLLKSGALMITGELGDQLAGSDLLVNAARKFGASIIKADYREAAPRILELATRTPGTGKPYFEHLHPMIEECPFPIRTAHDFFWWFNFSQKWQHVKYRYAESASWDLRVRLGTHLEHFYDTPHFQRWSLDNHDLKIRDTAESYKFTAKEFIYGFTKDRAQLGLLKRQSLATTYVLDKRRIAITANHEAVTSLEELKQYVRYDL
jgi:hypothetical protein